MEREKPYESFNFFSLPQSGKKKKHPVPDLRCISKLIEDEVHSSDQFESVDSFS